MKNNLLILLFLVMIITGCRRLRKGCADIQCGPCAPFYNSVLQFDTMSFTGFKSVDLDSVYFYSYDQNMIFKDSTIRDFSKSYFGEWWNILDASKLDYNYDRENFISGYYKFRIKGYSKVYEVNNLAVQFIPNDPKKCCDCDAAKVTSLSFNDTFYNSYQLPILVKK